MVVLEMLVVVLFAIVSFLAIKYIYLRANFEQRVKEWLQKEEDRIRKDAIERSARTLSGKTLEKLIPFLDKFPYNPHDLRWLGDPIDFVIFDGYSKKSAKQIVFCEVKSGDSNLTKSQNELKELIENKKVKWFEFRI
ncbi:MAG: Holliday junction resolvase-like protein [Candidatus Aenigmatarchaeota archaeon]